jgi:hypothetical protein
MTPTPGAPAQGDKRAEMLQMSAEQSERFGAEGSPVIYESPAFYPLLRMGVRPGRRNPEVACELRITEDGMVTCTVQGNGELVWSAHLDPPNEWKLSGVTFVFVRVADHTFTTRGGPFVANLSPNMGVPFVGFFQMFGGFKQRKELLGVLTERRSGPARRAS